MHQKLGQHFLVNKQIVADILRAGEVSKNDLILEVGPGKGILTEALAEKAKKVIAVEKDKNLVEYLKDKFSARGESLPAGRHGALGGKNKKNIEIIYGDILKINSWYSYVNSYHSYRIKIIANIPYYITSRFLRIFLTQTKFRPKLMVLMVQKEVAERIMARDNRESLLSLSVKAYGKPEIIKIVRRGNFFPPPKVDSAIIKITTSPPSPLSLLRRGGKKRDNHLSSGGGVEQILSLARKAFQQKRKMLRRSLGKNIPKKYQNKRPEELKLEEWKEIINF